MPLKSWMTSFRERPVEALLGLYLVFYAIRIWPYSTEVFSNEGLVPREMFGVFISLPSWLAWSESPAVIRVLLGLVVLLGLCLGAGRARKGAVVGLFLIHLHLYNINSAATSPETAFIQLALLLTALEDRLSREQRLFLAWLALGVGYTYSGISKLETPVWLNGKALMMFINHSDSVRLWVPSVPDLFAWPLRIVGWVVLALEIAALPLVTFRAGRILVWGLFALFHFVNIFIFDFVQLSVGCLLFHLLILEWGRREKRDPVLSIANLRNL